VFSGMLGVTLFGLALTPVFFYAIDWWGESRAFALPWVRRANRAVLGALSLRPARQLGWAVYRQLAATARQRFSSGAKKPLPPFPLLPEEEGSGFRVQGSEERSGIGDRGSDEGSGVGGRGSGRKPFRVRPTIVTEIAPIEKN
jgi:hypothetical protein